MTALSSGRTTPRRDGDLYSRPVAAGAKIWPGALVALNAARTALPGQTAVGLLADGVSEDLVDNTAGNAGDKRVTVRAGVFPFANSAAGDLIAQADIGAPPTSSTIRPSRKRTAAARDRRPARSSTSTPRVSGSASASFIRNREAS